MSDAKNEGTVSDPNNLLEAMFFAHEVEKGVQFFGFYRSKEGREFLRKLFEPYLRRQSIGEGKAATIIADSHPNSDYQDREVDKTKSALRRWRNDGQNELWPKDEEKNLRCLQRLENEFLAVQELREIMEDTAETVQKHQTGIAFANFFYGALPARYADPEIEELHFQFEGLYHGQGLRFDAAVDSYEDVKKEIFDKLIKQVRTTGIAPNLIDFQLGKLDPDNAIYNTRETAGYMLGGSSGYSYYYLTHVDKRNFMLVQEFALVFENGKDPRTRKHSVGYAYPMLDGSLHMLMTDTVPSSRKTYVAFTPDDSLRPEALNNKPEDYLWRVDRSPFGKPWERMSEGKENVYWEKINIGDRRFDYLNVDRILKFLDRSKWNLVP